LDLNNSETTDPDKKVEKVSNSRKISYLNGKVQLDFIIGLRFYSSLKFVG